MRSLPRKFASTSLLVLSATAASCATDSVPPDIYALYPTNAQSKVDAGKASTKGDAGSGTKQELEPSDDGNDDTTGNTDDGTADDTTDGTSDKAPGDTKPDAIDGGTKPRAEAGAAVDNGPCDMTGKWLITQHTVESGLGVKQAGTWWFYYEVEQNGSNLTVTKGLVCGGKVIPLDAIGANVDWDAAWPKITEKNTQHTGRRGKVTASGTSCDLTLDPVYSVLGATSPHYADDSTTMPLLAEKADGDKPGWEDWDNDSKPGVSLKVSGIVTGSRYTALRNLQDWKGKFTAGTSPFKVPAIAKQDQSVLGVTTDLLKSSSVTEADPALHFAQFAKLKANQVQGDDQAMCATIRELAPKLTPEANK